jgi:uncharacterized membrane protein
MMNNKSKQFAGLVVHNIFLFKTALKALQRAIIALFFPQSFLSWFIKAVIFMTASPLKDWQSFYFNPLPVYF